ncbi:unnamed protein product [Gordionus sp. m RMFG-2023]
MLNILLIPRLHRVYFSELTMHCYHRIFTDGCLSHASPSGLCALPDIGIVIPRLFLSPIVIFPTRIAGPYRRYPLMHFPCCPCITYRSLNVTPRVATIPCRIRILETVTSQVAHPATPETLASLHCWLVSAIFPTPSSHP